MTQAQMEAAGVVFVESSHDGYWECADCGGLAGKEDHAYGIDPADHTCSA